MGTSSSRFLCCKPLENSVIKAGAGRPTVSHIPTEASQYQVEGAALSFATSRARENVIKWLANSPDVSQFEPMPDDIDWPSTPNEDPPLQ